MAPITQSFSNLLCIIIMLFFCAAQQSIALTIELIHRYAPQSPFYNANLTHQERVEMINFHTRTVGKQPSEFIDSTKRGNQSSVDLTAIRPSLDVDPQFLPLLVKVNLGTFSSDNRYSHKSYFLDFDTGGTLTWLQCEDCKKDGNHCYRQIEPPYPNSKSSSYKPLPCHRHRLCHQDCIGESCLYHLTYADNSHSVGILAHESFAFPSNSGHEEIIPLVFGCGIDSKRPYGEHQDLKMAGVFGIGWGRHSFVTQIHPISRGIFSYCLPLASQIAQGSPAFLRFGSDIPLYSNLPKTRLITYTDDHSYYANLLDVSINNVKVNIPSIYFQKGGHGFGGCIFDTGSIVTRMSPRAYQLFRKAMETYIAQSDTSLEMIGYMDGYDLCYRRPKPSRGYTNLPSITFHFEGNADLMVAPEAAFHLNSHNIHYDYICLEMVPTGASRMTVIGAHTQANQFIVYDLPGRKLYFGHRDCSRNP